MTDVVIGRLSTYLKADTFADLLAAALIKAVHGLLRGIPPLLEDIGKFGAKALIDSEDAVSPLFGGLVAPIVANMFGSSVSSDAFASRDATGARSDAADEIVRAFLGTLTASAGAPSEPDTEPAQRFAAAGVHAAIEGWFNAFIAETLGEVIPWDWLRLHDLVNLPDEVISALGVGRLVRRALAPLVDATAATPMKWATEKTYRSQLLSASSVARQWARGRWDWSDVVEELARQGYTDERIDALINEQRKFVSVSDAELLVRHKVWTGDEALQYLRDQGWAEDDARIALRAEGARQVEANENQLLTSAISAFVDRRIDRAQLATFLQGAVTDDGARQLALDLADARQTFNVKPLSPSEAKSCVMAGILAVPDYRAALEQDGYAPDAIDALELLLRKELDTKADVEKLRAQQQADKAAAAQAKADAAAKRQAQIDQQRALERRGKVSDLTDAVVRGLIPVSRLEEVLAADYDSDTVNILVQLAEQKRAAYVAQQQKAADAEKRAAGVTVGLADLKSAVLEHVLSIDEFRKALADRGVAPGDVSIIADTLAARLAAVNKATQDRAAAAADAKKKSINLSTFEQLVRRGARTMDEYDQLLQSLGYDDASRAGIEDLLRLKIADDQTAAQKRASAEPALNAKGLSLEQLRRAVLLGVKTPADYQAFLVDQKFTPDAIAVLMAELADDVSAADAARQKRQAADALGGSKALPVSTVARAARLGIVTPDDYRAALTRAGYSADDIALELDLLSAEIADTQATRATQAAAPAAPAAKGLTLTQLERAVKGGAATVDDYRAAAISTGLSADAVNTLVAQLEAELAALHDAKSVHDKVAAELAARGQSLTDLEDQVRAGAISLDDYHAELVSLGYSADDADFLEALLADQLSATTPTV